MPLVKSICPQLQTQLHIPISDATVDVINCERELKTKYDENMSIKITLEKSKKD